MFIDLKKQYRSDGQPRFGEVHFYFRCQHQERQMTLALVSAYSEPNQRLLEVSHGTFASCQYFGDATLTVIDVLCIESVVAMVPHNPPHSKDSESHCFLVERPGLDIAILSSDQEPIDKT